MNYKADLSTELLFTFIHVVEQGGINRTAERLHKTQSAVSMQMQRLEERVGQKLFYQSGRRKLLTPAGETMLVYARKLLDLQSEALTALQGTALEGELNIGVSHSLVESNLTHELTVFARQYPKILLSVKSGESRELEAAFGRGEYDYVIYLTRESVGSGDILGAYQMYWHASPDFDWQQGQMLPIASFSATCVFRQICVEVLRQANLPWREVYRTSSLSALISAVEGGLGVTARTAHAARGKTRILGAEAGLPALPEVFVANRYRKSSVLAGLIAEWIQNRPPVVA
ncbi:LysR substrate-binding domain-containing protein [Hahella ganghwensis]|uniref:LysR substrate-binding domain-containing protein n=1 Tax=Hahella ganghwensis TaxID=286420 RepID=UPI00036D0C9F|nr:LysR substrate-binding domain-containing protein [Hahella ganghwensis]